MKKIKLNVIPSVNTIDITTFILKNSKEEWNSCCTILSNELNHIMYELPNQIEMEDEFRIFKVVVKKLKYDGWIKKFTDTQELLEDYYILFTN